MVVNILFTKNIPHLIKFPTFTTERAKKQKKKEKKINRFLADKGLQNIA